MSTNVCMNFMIDSTMLTLLIRLLISLKTCLDRQCIFMSPQQAQQTRKGYTLILTRKISARRYLLTIMSCQRLTKLFIYFIKHGALAVLIDSTLFLHVFCNICRFKTFSLYVVYNLEKGMGIIITTFILIQSQNSPIIIFR